MTNNDQEITQIENREWLDSLDYLIGTSSPGRVKEILGLLSDRASKKGIHYSCPSNTPYINTISDCNGKILDKTENNLK